MTSEVSQPPTLVDVARAVGVSHQTVSRVINGSEAVHPQTRAKVLAAVEELGYHRNRAARALVTRRSGSIGVITADVVNFGPHATLAAVERAAWDRGFNVSLVALRNLTPSGLGQALQELHELAVEAVVLIAGGSLNAASDRLAGCRVPVVVVQGGPGLGTIRATVDHARGARAVTQHLLDVGHDSVLHLAGPSGWWESQARIEGWRSALRLAGKPAPPVRWRGDWTALSGYRIGDHIAADKAVTAVFVANDQMALGLLRALRETGRRVPEDVSVAGFDDIPEAAYFTPPLTTVRQDFGALGRSAVELLGKAIAGEAQPTTTRIPPELLVRDSTSSPSNPTVGHRRTLR